MGKERLWGTAVMFLNVLIDNGRETAPSKRILDVIPDYNKVAAGVDSLKQVGIEKLMAKCSHFAEWVGKWEGME